MSQQGLRPLSVTGIADEATRLLRRRFSLYYLLTLPVMIPLLFVVHQYFNHIYWYEGSHENYEPILLKWSICLTFLIALRTISHGAVCVACVDDIHGRTPTLSASVFAALKAAPKLIFGAALFWGSTLGLAFFVLPPLFFGPVFAGNTYYVMVDGKRYLGLIPHGFRSVKGHTGRILMLHVLLLMAMILAMTGLGMSIPTLVSMFQSLSGIDATLISSNLSQKNPPYIISLIFIVLAIFEPLRIIAQVRVCMDGKIRREGYDLMDRVTRLTGIDVRLPAGSAVMLLVFLGLSLGSVNAQEVAPSGLTPQAARQALRSAVDKVDELLIDAERGEELDPISLHQSLSKLDRIKISTSDQTISLIGGESLAKTTSNYDQLGQEELSAKLQQLKSRLELLESGLDSYNASNPPSKAQSPNASVKEILNQDRFRKRTRNLRDNNIESSAIDSAIQRFTNWIRGLQDVELPWWTSFKNSIKNFFTWIGSFFKGWSAPKFGGSGLNLGMDGYGSTFLIGLVALVIAGIVAWIVISMRRKGAGEAEDEITEIKYTTSQHVDPIVAYETTEETWRTDARRFASSKEYDFAVRSSYAGLLLTLNSLGWIEFNKTRTNWEYVRDVKQKHKDLAERIVPLTQAFDEKWYGKKECLEEEYLQFRALLDEVVTDLDEGN